MILFDNRQDKENFDNNMESLIEKVIKESLLIEQFKLDYEISVSLVDNEEIRDINREFRGIDRSTDVLSFPMIEYNGVYYTSNYEFNKIDIDPDGKITLGDIVLSLERAREQSLEYGHSFSREVAFLTVHSVLHLLGHDHEVEDERKIMREKEEKILNSLSYNR
ncbi:rRNA maturation RNase YbeY [Clostridium cylindrosporum]|uniref:Endoribonuclease YbeY n=1 Tax=Clostridium cylindrosporum DSM 605 TaxID=1121307 RepID=A0A0J8DBG2_CLOCY|nr:rRNA maturation RNase YbeY [Clostridium cylindrosporum]KMT21654.1 endoribonuclease YbeY [Clostridium cylindrosporum DSM 605]